MLEWQIRRRVLAIENVDIVHARVTEPTYDTAQGRVTGVLLDSGEVVPADLVVDAAGRGTRLPVWLEKWGYPRAARGDRRCRHRLRQPTSPRPRRPARREGRGGGRVARTTGRRRHAVLRRRRLERDDLRHRQGRSRHRTLRRSATWPTRSCPRMCRPRCGRAPRSARWRSTSTRPVGGAATTNSTRFPGGIFPFGDAVVSFNPTFGQGMTMTAIQANLRAVSSRRSRLDRAREGYGKTTYPVWMMTAIGDLALHDATTDKVPYKPVDVRSVPRRRDGSRTGRMVSAQIQPARQPTWCRRRASSAAPSGTTCGRSCREASARATPDRNLVAGRYSG